MQNFFKQIAYGNSSALPSLSPAQEFRDGLYFFKVSLASRYYTSDMWRRIAIPANCSLDNLSDMILRSIDFDDAHLY